MDKVTVIEVIKLLMREAGITADDLRSMAARGRTPSFTQVKEDINRRPSIFDDDPVVSDDEVQAIVDSNYPTLHKEQ